MQIQQVHKRERIQVIGQESRRARRKNKSQSFTQKLMQQKKYCPAGGIPASLNTIIIKTEATAGHTHEPRI